VENYPLTDNIVYINGIDHEEIITPIYEKLAEVAGIKSTMYQDSYNKDLYFLESFSESAGKWNGIKRIMETYGFDRVVTFGDNLNDIEMLENSDCGVAVSSGNDAVKLMADLVIGGNDEDSVARYLLDVWEIQAIIAKCL